MVVPGEGPTPLQKALVASMFGGRISVDKDFDLPYSKSQIVSVWSQRAVPEALNSFIQAHAGGAPISETKEARAGLFWDTLLEMS